MGLLDWIRFQSTRVAILRQGEEQAQKFGLTCDYVAQEFVRRNGLNTIPQSVWESCLRNKTCPAGLTQAVRSLLMAHAVHGVALEYAPTMIACALHRLGGMFQGDMFKDSAAISLVELIAPSVEKDVAVSIAAASVLAQLIYLEPERKLALSLRSFLYHLTESRLSNDHLYIWMKVEEVAELLKLE